MNCAPAPFVRNLEDFAGIASDWFFEMDENLRFTYFSSRFEEVSGLSGASLIGKRREEVVPPEVLDQPNWQQHLDDLKNRRPFRDFEYRVDRPNGHGTLWVRISAEPQFDAQGHFRGYRGAGHDVTAEKAAMQRLEQMNETLARRNRKLRALKKELELAAIEDPMTGLWNRRAFDTAIERALDSATPRVTLFLIDLDDFKAINDTHGHQAGDMVLVTTADRIVKQIGPGAGVYRMGGDEFAVIFERPVSPSEADGIGRRVIDTLRGPIVVGHETVAVGASVGYARADETTKDACNLMSRADAALYAAKDAGRNCVRTVA